jgi:hypothetical protein
MNYASLTSTAAWRKDTDLFNPATTGGKARGFLSSESCEPDPTAWKAVRGVMPFASRQS